MDLKIAGTTVLVSGGSKGMGKACAAGFAREGANVVITGRSPEAIEAACTEIRALGSGEVLGLLCDVGHLPDIEQVYAAIAERFGVLHTLINMAGPTDPEHYGGDFIHTRAESWDYYYKIGLMSVVHCSRLAVPLMRQAGWGRIVNISSQSARIGEPGQAAYMAIKSAVNALSKAMAWGLAKDDILVNSLTPGGVATDLMTERVRQTRSGAEDLPVTLEDLAGWLAEYVGPRSCGVIGRVAAPEEIVPHVLLLGSRLNTYCVGSNVAVDGGTDFSTG